MREIPRLWDGPWLARARVFAAVRWINTRAPERLRQERWRPGRCPLLGGSGRGVLRLWASPQTSGTGSAIEPSVYTGRWRSNGISAPPGGRCPRAARTRRAGTPSDPARGPNDSSTIRGGAERLPLTR